MVEELTATCRVQEKKIGAVSLLVQGQRGISLFSGVLPGISLTSFEVQQI